MSHCDTVMDFAKENPIKFVSLGTFITLGAVPLLAFLGYATAAVVASIIGAVLLDLFLISLAAVGLGLVLCCVTCVSLCTTSVFGAFYLGFRAVKKTAATGFRLKNKSTWPPTADPNDS